MAAPQLITAYELTTPYDLVLLSVKATALQQAIDDMAPAVGPKTTVVPLLNGLAHLGELTARFGAQPVLGGVAKVVTTLNAEGDIVELVSLANLDIGEQDGGPRLAWTLSMPCWTAPASPWASRRASSPRCGTSGSSSPPSAR